MGKKTAERLNTFLENELRNALAQLAHSPISPKKVHEARRSIKKLRSGLRLGQKAFGKARVALVNRPLRDAGHLLSPLRDREVLRKTAEKLRKPGEPIVRVPGMSAQDAVRVRKAQAELRQAEKTLKRLPWTEADSAALTRGLKRLYRRGRRAMRKADKERSDEALHAWRRRNKDLQYALPLIKAARRPIKESDHLSVFLGDDHDLAFFTAQKPPPPEKIVRRAGKRRQKLQKRAFLTAHRLYRRRPKALVRR